MIRPDALRPEGDMPPVPAPPPHDPGYHPGPPHHGPCGPHPEPPHHGPHGHHGPPPHGPHGPHGPHPEQPPGPGLDREQYEAMDREGKILAMIHALDHASRSIFDSRGGQNRALRLLKPGEAMTQRELTERLGIQPGSASELVGKLERAGLIRRQPSQTDRRTADVCLTEEGAARREEISRREQDAGRLFAALTDQERDTLLSLLEKLHGAWRTPPRPAPEDGPAPERPDIRGADRYKKVRTCGTARRGL